jgi:mitogen-activated protein kinase kinase kinase
LVLVVWRSDGIVKLADFGASKAYRDATITDGMRSLRGSVFWMAPEVIRGTGYGRKADIWSLGCTVIEMLTGRHPWPELDNHWSAMFQVGTSTGKMYILMILTPSIADGLTRG